MELAHYGRTLFLVLAGLCVASVATADSGEKSQILSVLSKVEASLARGDSAAKISDLLYAPDVVLVGEGDTSASHGMKEAVVDVQAWLDSLGANGQKSCKFEVSEPIVASTTTFSSFVLLRCAANPPKLPQGQELRMVYVWKKLPRGWRVQLEMWASGKF